MTMLKSYRDNKLYAVLKNHGSHFEVIVRGRPNSLVFMKYNEARQYFLNSIGQG